MMEAASERIFKKTKKKFGHEIKLIVSVYTQPFYFEKLFFCLRCMVFRGHQFFLGGPTKWKKYIETKLFGKNNHINHYILDSERIHHTGCQMLAKYTKIDCIM